MNFLGNLGVDIWLLLAQIVNFVVLLWVLSKFIYKPIIARIEHDEAVLHEVKTAQLALVEDEIKLEQKIKQHTTRSRKKAKLILDEAAEMATVLRQTAQAETDREKKAVLTQINKRLAEISHGKK